MLMSHGCIGSNDTSTKTRRGRASKPKTRTGCKTCKLRRVKCDETKPSCLRCLKFHGTCDGFGYSSVTIQPATKALLPKPVRARPTLKIEAKSVPRLNLNDFQPSLFTNEQEHSSFRYFHDKTANRLAGYFDESSMWNRLVLQACESDQSIRHAVIAIGALDMALDTAQVRKKAEWLEPAKVQLQAESQRQFALQSYGKAIKRMRDALSEPRQDMRTILIACLLFVAFESFHGNNNSAVQQAHGGIKLLNGWLPQWVSKDKNDHELKGLRSPAPHKIEDELVQAFARLDTVAIGSMDLEPIQIHPSLKPEVSDILRLMPEQFWDIEEARMYHDLIWRTVIHFILWMHGWGAPVGYDTSKAPSPGQIFEGQSKRAFVNDLKAKPDMLAEARRHCELFERWTAAFDPLFRQSRTPAGRKDFIAATVLRLHFKAGYISISGGFADPLDFDKRTSEYNEVLDLAGILTDSLSLREAGQRATFMMYGPLSGCLYIVVTCCRDGAIRRRAIDLMLRQPRREGLWDSLLTARVCQTVLEIEERGMVDGFIPLSSRINNVKTTFNMQLREGRITYTWFEPPNGQDTLEIMSADFTW